MKPMRRTEGLVVKELEDEVLVYDLERHRAHCLNAPAGVDRWCCCMASLATPGCGARSSTS